ncbi:MAG: hypothetical protein QOF69_3955 [Solirubrobacteraceae bacterium]|jgi:hypothetical protein|nr:hypothetical protein [Solirubrobacteraceae bacterium]MEA2184770.1 hypothetical protein [Solirubrobacteraceae bacterium]
MTSQRARVGATALGAAGVAFAVIQLLQGTVSAFDPRPVVSLALAVAVGIVGVTLERLRHTVGQRRVLSAALRAWPLMTVSDADPLALGVFPARAAMHSASGAPYVARDADQSVQEAARAGGIVVVYGPPRAGKSRTAYEAARLVLPDTPVVIPDGGAALRRAVEDASFVPPDGAVWWLDDLERFTQHLEGSVFEALVDTRWTVVTTVREESWRELLRAAGDVGDRARRLLAAATTVHLSSQLSAREYQAAGELYPGIDVSGGIGEALSAGSDHKAVPVGKRGEPRRTRQRLDPVLGMSIALSVAAVAIVASLVSAGGFAVRRAPRIGAQLEAIRQAAARAGKTTVLARAVRLHEVDQPSELWSCDPSPRDQTSCASTTT